MIGEAEIEEYYQFLEQLEKKQAQYKDHPDTYLGQQIDLLQQLLAPILLLVALAAVRFCRMHHFGQIQLRQLRHVLQ